MILNKFMAKFYAKNQFHIWKNLIHWFDEKQYVVQHWTSRLETLKLSWWWLEIHQRQSKPPKNQNTNVFIAISLDIQRIIVIKLWDIQNGGIIANTSVVNNTWIIDFGASGHVIFYPRQVTNLRTSFQRNIFTTNGNKSPIIGEGHVSLTNTLNLDFVLVVLSLNYNLLLISQITKALSCIVIL